MGSTCTTSKRNSSPQGVLHNVRRVSVQIYSKRYPDVMVPGYMILQELGGEILSFFSTKKFKHEEQLEVMGEIHGKEEKFNVELAQCHEQISSGRVMTSVPIEGQPLPTRTFYRCFARILREAAKEAPAPVEESSPTDIAVAPATMATVTELKPAEAAPTADVAAVAEAPPAAQAA